ncbi:MAG TPA: hypothetical protein EYP56_11280 [Planctomycetaceae bacterium]|nr:hypothetical protein [Planctomycetaceae bacterium]
MRCPGQDRRYWKEDAVFDVPCPECGAEVEFFKDEPAGRCPNCGHRFRNPGIDYGCAAWCSLAEKCLGLVPQTPSAVGSKEGALAGRLIQSLREVVAGDSTRLTHALKVYHFAKDLVAKEAANPRLTLAAALVLDLAMPVGAGTGESNAQLDLVRQVLRSAGADEDTVAGVCQLVIAHWAGQLSDATEARILHDADTLAGLTAGDRQQMGQRVREAIDRRLQTAAARERAQALFQALLAGGQPDA